MQLIIKTYDKDIQMKFISNSHVFIHVNCDIPLYNLLHMTKTVKYIWDRNDIWIIVNDHGHFLLKDTHNINAAQAPYKPRTFISLDLHFFDRNQPGCHITN